MHHEKQSQNQSDRADHLTQHPGIINPDTIASQASGYRLGYAQTALFDRVSNENRDTRNKLYRTSPCCAN